MAKKSSIKLLLCLVLVIATVGIAAANGPELMVYSGSIPQGLNQGDGFYDISFSIYASEQGGNALWTETQSVYVYQGTFGVYLGAVQKLNLPFDLPYWVGVKAGDKEDIWPLTGAGYPTEGLGAGTASGNAAIAPKAVAADEVLSANIKEADGTTGQNTNAGSGIKTGHIQNNAVTAAKIAASAVTAGKIAANAVTIPKIASNAVTTPKIADNAVTTPKIADGAVNDAKITGPITGSKINSVGLNADTVDNKHAADFVGAGQVNSIGTAMITDGAVTNAKITGPITGSKIDSAGLNADTLDTKHAGDFVLKAGDTMTGTLNLPVNGLIAGTDQLVLSGGNVGIGTASPSGKLSVSTSGAVMGAFTSSNLWGALSLSEGTTVRTWFGYGNAGSILTNALADSTALRAQTGGLHLAATYDALRGITVMPSGYVGLGTTAPGGRLHIKGAGWPDSFIYLDTTAAAQDSGLRFYENGTVKSHLYWSASAGNLRLQGSGALGIDINSSGKVGIGTAIPAFDLDIDRGAWAVAKFGRTQPLYIMQSWSEIGFNTYYDGSYKAGKGSTSHYGGSIWFNAGSGDFNFQTSTGPASADGVLTMKNVMTVSKTGDVYVGVLHITGGADLAEPFDVRERARIKPGMLVAIDPDNPGALRLTESAYDRTVAGVVSGANGIKPGVTLKQEGTSAEGNIPVALTGRVYCMADASKGAIKPGDLLTSSDIPGYAMKATDYSRSQGAIIGKAMSLLSEGQGMVLVLVTLQ